MAALLACAGSALAQGGQAVGNGMHGGAPSPDRSAPQPDKVRLFNIPAQSLSAALEAYGVVTGNQLIYDSRLVEHRRSNPVVGLFSPETSLRMLLDGTDLTIRYTGPRDITLVPIVRLSAGDRDIGADAAAGELTLDTLYIDVAAGASDRPDYADYGRIVRLQIRQALVQSPETARRIYHVRLAIMIDADGRLQMARLLRSSGFPALDREIGQVVASIKINRPPPKGIPQPIRVTIIAI